MAIGTRSPVSSSARLEPGDDRVALGRASSRAARGRRRGSSRRRRRARRGASPSRPGRAVAATSWPNGSRPGLPTVQRPKVKWSSGTGVNASLMTSPGVCSLIALRSGHGSAAENRPSGDARAQPGRGARRGAPLRPARAHRGGAAHVVGQADGVRDRRRAAQPKASCTRWAWARAPRPGDVRPPISTSTSRVTRTSVCTSASTTPPSRWPTGGGRSWRRAAAVRRSARRPAPSATSKHCSTTRWPRRASRGRRSGTRRSWCPASSTARPGCACWRRTSAGPTSRWRNCSATRSACR